LLTIVASELSAKHCIPCRGGVPPLQGAALTVLLQRLGGDWRVVDGHHLAKAYAFEDFKDALAFTNAVGAIAEREGHHPDIHLAWGRVGLEIWTHKIDGLTESDFVLAAKADEAFARR
jgi:4a-hydroxytetrahydrobiopterin dehydratase